ncbi:MAG: acetolactate synthase large subunit [Pseudomonadota bacterium]
MADTSDAQDIETKTGAQALVETLADCGVTACFANPGTSEMHLVVALDHEPRIHSTLCLFEGVATGAADGFARIAGGPAMTLLHLGPGYLNGGANIHNARRANAPMINVVGDHAVPHRKLDAPLASNITGMAAPNSRWIKSADHPSEAGRLAAEAFAASYGPAPGPVTLILPADTAWTNGAAAAPAPMLPGLRQTSAERIAEAAAAVKAAKKPVILINGNACLDEGLDAAARLKAYGVRILTDTFIGRHARGAGRFTPDRMQYFAEAAISDLAGVDLLVLAGTTAPVSFFAYPNTPSELTPDEAETLSLAGPDGDAAAALRDLADALGAEHAAPAPERADVAMPTGVLSASSVGASVARHMPDDSIVSDDGVTSSMGVFLSTADAARHDWLYLTGGAIGQGMPLAVGAATARPNAKTICLTGDGAGMYTVQALWTMAREKLDVTTIVFVNHSYRILNVELARTGAGNPGPAAESMLSLGGPEIDWVKLSEAQGVPATLCAMAEDFDVALERAMSEPGPHLIAAMVEG